MNKKIDFSYLQNPHKSAFYILDIDSTLISTHQRNQAILNQFIVDHKNKFPTDCERLKEAQCQLGDYGYHSTLKRIHFKPRHQEILIQLENFWRQHFFSNNYLHHDVPMKGAVDWVKKISQKNIHFIYLTARHKHTMWSGTLDSLNKLGFPISESNLYLKEDLNQTDEGYKVITLKNVLKNQSEKEIIFIDNEPLVLHKVLEHFPHVKLVWFHSTHSGKKTPPHEALEIKDFDF